MAADNVKLSQYYGTSHFSSNVNWEPQRDAHWELKIDLPDTQFPDKINSTRRSFTNVDEEVIRLAVQSVGLPQLGVTPAAVRRGNDQVWFATNPQMGGNFNITCIDAIGHDVQNLLLDWFRLIYNFDGNRLMGLAVNYKTTATLFVFAPDASVIRAWEIYGLFPTSLQIPPMGTQGGFTTINASFSCDRLERVSLATSNS